MMKIALCFSGMIRKVEDNFQYWKSFKEKYNADVYISAWDTPYAKEFSEYIGSKKTEIESFDSFQHIKDVFLEEYVVPSASFHPKGLSNVVDREYYNNGIFLNMWYKIWRCNYLSKNEEYDVIVRVRNDIFLDKKFEIKNNQHLNIPYGYMYNPVWINSGGPGDMFAYGPPKIMDYYSSCFLYLTRYLKENKYFFPAESLLRHHLCELNVDINFLANCVYFFRNKKNEKSNIDNCYCDSKQSEKDYLFNISDWCNHSDIEEGITFYKPR